MTRFLPLLFASILAAPVAAIERNVGSQKLTLQAIDRATGGPKTGDAANITAYVSIDGDTSPDALGDTSATELSATNLPGVYQFDLTQAETNGVSIVYGGKSSTAGVDIVARQIHTVPSGFSQLAIISGTVTVGTIEDDAITELSIASGAIGNDEFNVTETLNADAVAISADTTAAERLETMLDGTGGNTLSLGSLAITGGATVANSSGVGLTITGGGAAGIGLDVTGAGLGPGARIRSGSGSAATALEVTSLATNGSAVALTGAGSGHGLIIAAGATGSGAVIQGSANGLHVSATNGPGMTAIASAGNFSGVVVTGSGTGHGAIFTSGSGATGNGIQATAASTSGNGLALTGMGSGSGLAGSVSATINANVIQWLSTGVTTNVSGIPKVDITHVLGDPVCD